MANRVVVMGQCFIIDGTAAVAEAGRLIADATINVTDPGGTGTFDIYVASGTTCVITDGTSACDVTGNTLNPGKTTVTITGTGTLTFDITIGVAANTNDANTWADTSGGVSGFSPPSSSTPMLADALSFTAGSQVLTVNATANTLDLDFTGSLNTPTLAGASELKLYGSLTFISAMNRTYSGNMVTWGAGAQTLTLAGRGIFTLHIYSSNVIFADTVVINDTLRIYKGTLNTNGQTVTVPWFNNTGSTDAHVLTMGNSIINVGGGVVLSTGGLTVTANTATINVSGTGAGAFGNADYNGASFNFNGTAHVLSGSPTGINILTRNGTATKTDTLTLTSGDNITCTTFAPIGNSSTNRVLVQSSVLGTAATITATNWTGANACDLMDITSTNAVDLSGAAAYSGDCGGNTNITFTAASAQTSTSTASWATAAGWSGRVPLPQDDVTCSHSKTVDMPRFGRDITFTGTPTIYVPNGYKSFGSVAASSGTVFTASAYWELRGRGAHTIDIQCNYDNGFNIYAVDGSYTFSSNLSGTGNSNAIILNNGELYFNGKDITTGLLAYTGASLRTLNLGSGTITLGRADATTKVNAGNIANLTFDAGTSTIILTNSTANAQTFAGGGLTYNNVTVEGAGNYALTVTGNNTFNTFKVDASEAVKRVNYTDGSTQTVGKFTRNPGTKIITLRGTGVAGWAITKSDSVPLDLDYMDIDYSTASPVSTFYAGVHSVDGGHNTAWEFAESPLAGDFFGFF